MKLATVRQIDGTTRAARVEGDEIVLLPFADVGELLATHDGWKSGSGSGQRIPVASVEFVGLIPNPSKVLCIGRNYLEHVREGSPKAEAPPFPELFTKFAESLAGPYDDIPLPAGNGPADFRAAIAASATFPTVSVPVESDCVDWEAELVVVVGTAVRRANAHEAEAAIAGFTIGNDVSVRDWQMHTSQWTQGKAWESMSPVGPVLVTVDELGVRPDLNVRCLIDGELMQDFRTSGVVFDPVELVCYLSRIVTLSPGDMIFTGTGKGVGITKDPEVYLRPGQVLRTEIEGIGEIVNTMVAEELSSPEQHQSEASNDVQLVEGRA